MTHDKDILEKKLEDYNDVFADIINALLPLNEKIAPEDLQDVRARNIYSSSGEIHEQERDTVKLWTKGEIIFCLLGLENQSKIDKAMPVRVAGLQNGIYSGTCFSSYGNYFAVNNVIKFTTHTKK